MTSGQLEWGVKFTQMNRKDKKFLEEYLQAYV
jgi:hypothetical protein